MAPVTTPDDRLERPKVEHLGVRGRRTTRGHRCRQAASPRRLNARMSPRWSCSARNTSMASLRLATARSRLPSSRSDGALGQAHVPEAERRTRLLEVRAVPRRPNCRRRRRPGSRRQGHGRSRSARAASGSSAPAAKAVASSARRSAVSRSYSIVLKTTAHAERGRTQRAVVVIPRRRAPGQRSSQPAETRIVPNQNGASIEQISSASRGSATSAQPTASRIATSSSWTAAIVAPFVWPRTGRSARSRTHTAWARRARRPSPRAMSRSRRSRTASAASGTASRARAVGVEEGFVDQPIEERSTSSAASVAGADAPAPPRVAPPAKTDSRSNTSRSALIEQVVAPVGDRLQIALVRPRNPRIVS